MALRLLQLDQAAEDLIQKEIEAEKTGVEHDCILPDVPEEDLDSIFNSLMKIWIKYLKWEVLVLNWKPSTKMVVFALKSAKAQIKKLLLAIVYCNSLLHSEIVP